MNCMVSCRGPFQRSVLGVTDSAFRGFGGNLGVRILGKRAATHGLEFWVGIYIRLFGRGCTQKNVEKYIEMTSNPIVHVRITIMTNILT